jgi:hypothetical protein
MFMDLPPEIRNTIYEYCVTPSGPMHMMETMDIKKSRMQSLLSVNRQIREEAFPIFYSTNQFNFDMCHAKYITRWLFHGVQPKHLKFISSIYWTSSHQWTRSWGGQLRYYSDHVKVYSESCQDQALYLSSVIMLLELGLLGSCKVKMTLYNDERLHVACKIRELIRKTIARKKLTEVDTWNEKSVPGEDDVAGLSYAVSKEWGRTLPQVFQDDLSTRRPPPLAPEMYCTSCQVIDTLPRHGLYFPSILPWVSGDEATGTKCDPQEGSLKLGANQ